MTDVQKEYKKMRIMYQKRYYEAWQKHQKCAVGETNHGVMLEMSYVLINIFGLTHKQVEEVERNKGYTNEDLSRQVTINPPFSL